MKIKIALCDHDPKALPVIAGAAESVFRDRGFHIQVDRFQNCEMLMSALEQEPYRLILMNIDMPDTDGIQAAKQIRQQHRAIQIVFVSEDESRVFEALTIQPLGFIRKNHFFDDLTAVIGLYLETCLRDPQNSDIEFVTRNGMTALNGEKICYIEGHRNYQMVYMAGEEVPVEVKMTMERLERILEPYGFLRIHKGYLVNYRYIRNITYGRVILQDGTSLPVGRSKSARIRSLFLSMAED